MPYKKCCVVGCEDKISSRHRLPNPNKFMDRYKLWVQKTGNDTLQNLDPVRVYENYRICHLHFTAEDISSNMFLKHNAVPSRFLPSVFIETQLEADITSIPSTSKRICSEQVVLDAKEPEYDLEDVVAPKHQNSHVKMSILQDVGVTRVNQLSPKAELLYRKTRIARKSLNVLRRRTKLLKIKSVQSKQDILGNATRTLHTHVAKFVESQIRLSGVSSRGRRFTLDDKVLALILHKQSGKGCKILSRLFCLPARKTMMQLLNRIPITTGINEPLFDNLKANVCSLKENEKVCVVMFDEMQVQPQIIFNRHTKEFEGYEDMGDKTTSEIADHALVFMVKGITRKWKQPLTYSFCQGTVKTIDLARHIQLVITQCQKAGLQVMATVCDQGATNAAAINYLVQTNGIKKEIHDLKMFLVNGQPIVYIFDSPHLLKGVRNNFLTKDLIWHKGEETLCAKWEHIVQVFEEDNSPGELRTLPKITAAHVYENQIKKMKVSHAAQIFSHMLAAQMSLLSQTRIIKDQDAKDTSQVVAFFDELFDSVNGHTFWPFHGKKWKCAVSKESGHLLYWMEARKHITNMRFVNKKGEFVNPPSLKNWLSLLNGMQELLKLLIEKNINYFCPRAINQDPLENFFRTNAPAWGT